MRLICCKWAGAAKRHIPFLHLGTYVAGCVHAFTPDASSRYQLGGVFQADVGR